MFNPLYKWNDAQNWFVEREIGESQQLHVNIKNTSYYREINRRNEKEGCEK